MHTMFAVLFCVFQCPIHLLYIILLFFFLTSIFHFFGISNLSNLLLPFLPIFRLFNSSGNSVLLYFDSGSCFRYRLCYLQLVFTTPICFLHSVSQHTVKVMNFGSSLLIKFYFITFIILVYNAVFISSQTSFSFGFTTEKFENE